MDQIRYMSILQDSEVHPVAVKTCKEENEETMTEKFLEEACEFVIFTLRETYTSKYQKTKYVFTKLNLAFLLVTQS